MYLNNAFYLSTTVVRNEAFSGGSFGFLTLATRKTRNGLMVKNTRGDSLVVNTREQSADIHLILRYQQEVHGEEISRTLRVSNEFAPRIVTYIRDYFGKYITNCSTFAEYLKTGVFRECDLSRRGFMLSGGMNTFTGQKVRPGDSLCVFYFSNWVGSRKSDLDIRKIWRKCDKNPERSLHKLMGADRSYSANELFRLYDLGVFTDYHFMYCIGVNNGQPVFIQQMGRNDPRISTDLNRSPIVISEGAVDVSHQDRPACAFIKRGGRK